MDQVLTLKAHLSYVFITNDDLLWWVVTIVKQPLLMRNTDNNTVYNINDNFKKIYCKNTES